MNIFVMILILKITVFLGMINKRVSLTGLVLFDEGEIMPK